MPDMRDLPGLGPRLRQARIDSGLSQGQAAQLLGLHRPAISEIEGETRRVTAGELRDFSLLYQVSSNWLLGETPEEEDAIRMAARNLNSLKEDDRDTVMRIIDSFRRK